VPLLNRLGMHARPATMLAKTARKFAAKITVGKDGSDIDARSVLGLLTMGARRGSLLRLRAEGSDAEEAVAALERLILDKFGEE